MEGFDAFVILDAVHDAAGRIVDFRYVEVNSHVVKRLGRASRDALLGKTLSEVIPAPQADAYIEKYARVVATQVRLEEEEAVDLPDVQTTWVARHIVPLGDGVAITSRDTSQLRANEQERKELVAFLDSIIENVPATILVKNAETLRFEIFNRAGEELFGMPRASVIGKSNHEVFPKHMADAFEASDREVLASGKVFTMEQRVETARGERWFHSKKILLHDHLGAPRHLVGISVDITALKQAEKGLREASLVDELTGLHNRRGLFTLGEQLLKMAQRPRGPNLVLLFIDLDGLKQVNDAFGHVAGDVLLREAAAFLRKTFREADIVARLGGDEFVVLAACEPSNVEAMMARLEQTLGAYNAARVQRPLAMSVGVSQISPGSTLNEVLEDADRKMYEAKSKRALHTTEPNR